MFDLENILKCVILIIVVGKYPIKKNYLVTFDIKSSSDMLAERNLALMLAKTSDGSSRRVCPLASLLPFIDSLREI